MTGVFDSHVHAAPDVVPRGVDDLGLLQAYEQAGARGFVLKAHHESTVGRAYQLDCRSSLRVVGGVALNRSSGGLNPAAVLAALEAGARVVWMPTEDSGPHSRAGLPRLTDVDPRAGAEPIELPPITPGNRDVLESIVALIADYDAVLATGHVGARECDWLIDAAARFGVQRVLLTHPSYAVPDLDTAVIEGFVARGAHVEITAYQLIGQPGMEPSRLAAVAAVAGGRLILSSDVGQPRSPKPPEALEKLASTLKTLGIDPSLIRDAMSTIPAELFLDD